MPVMENDNDLRIAEDNAYPHYCNSIFIPNFVRCGVGRSAVCDFGYHVH